MTKLHPKPANAKIAITANLVDASQDSTSPAWREAAGQRRRDEAALLQEKSRSAAQCARRAGSGERGWPDGGSLTLDSGLVQPLALADAQEVEGKRPRVEDVREPLKEKDACQNGEMTDERLTQRRRGATHGDERAQPYVSV